MSDAVTMKEAADWRNGPPDAELDLDGLTIRRAAIQRRLVAVNARINESSSLVRDIVVGGERAADRSRMKASGGNGEAPPAVNGDGRGRAVELDIVQHFKDAGIVKRVTSRARKPLSTRQIAEKCLAEGPEEYRDANLSEVSKRLTGHLKLMAKKGFLKAIDGPGGRTWERAAADAGEG